MGASDSKLVFKKGIFKLSEERHIRADDPYWTSFWELPESPEDFFSIFTAADVRRTRDNALENLETLILAVTSRLFLLRHHPSFPDPELAPERDALNCVRILTRILPFLYELESLQAWEEQFFWARRRKRTRKSSITGEVLFDEARPQQQQQADEDEALASSRTDLFEDAKPLGEELVDTLVDLLFYADLTVPAPQRGKPNVTYAIWQSGVGCNAAVATTKEFESNRCEILRLLLTLSGQSMYFSPAILPARGVRALTYLANCPDKQVVLSALCSLLNTTLKYNPASWRVPYNSLVFKDDKLHLVTYSLQLLLVVLIYPIPEQVAGGVNKNYYRHFLGRLHRPQDFQFIVDGMTRILNQPLQANSTYLPGSQSSIKFAPEMLMLFWEITQCNKRFRSFIIDTERAHDFVILILFYALEYKNDASKQGVVRMCAFLLQTLSVEKNFGINLNKTFGGQETLPTSIRIVGFSGTYADFLIQSIYNLITTSQGRLSAIYPALLAIINNIAPYLKGISVTTSSKLLQLFSSMSSPSFLLANESNHDLLSSLLEALNSIIEHQYSGNPEFVYVLLKHKKRFEALRSFTLESGQEEMARRNRQRKEGQQHHDGLDPTSRRSSADSLRSPTTATGPQLHGARGGLSDVPEGVVVGGAGGGRAGRDNDDDDDTFAIGDDDEDSDADDGPTPAPSTPSENPSRASSVADHVDDGPAVHSATAVVNAAAAHAAAVALPAQLRGMSEKARGKMPAGHSFSRQNSITSAAGSSGDVGGSSAAGGLGSSMDGAGGNGFSGIGGGGGLGGGGAGLAFAGAGAFGHFEPTAPWLDSWLPELPLHTVLTTLAQLSAIVPRAKLAPDHPPRDLARQLQDVKLVGLALDDDDEGDNDGYGAAVGGAASPRVHSFEWTQPALAWYESLVWALVFSAEMQVGRGTVGVWNGTAIRLFRVQETAAQGPSLASPRGAVDAVGSNIVSRIGAINLRGGASQPPGSAGVAAGASPTAGAGGGAGGAGGLMRRDTA